MQLTLRTADDMHDLGRRVAECSTPGTVIAVLGDLGAGKTVFSRGLGAGLQVPTRVNSPTFVIVQSHPDGRLPFWHADLYRLDGLDSVEQLGLDEILEGDGVVAVEWPERCWECFPADRLEVRIADAEEGRRVSLRATGPRHQQLLERLGHDARA